MRKELTISTKNKLQVMDITDRVEESLDEGVEKVHIFARHTTCAITTADLDPGGTDQDYLEALTAMIPKLDYRHPHDPAHMPDHILATLIGPEVTIPISQGQLELGKWQRVVLIEFDGPRQRSIVISS